MVPYVNSWTCNYPRSLSPECQIGLLEVGEGRVTSPSARPGTRQLGSGTTHLTRKCRGFPEMHQKIRKDRIFASRLEASKNRLSEGEEMKAVSSLITGRGHNRAILLARSLARSLTHSLSGGKLTHSCWTLVRSVGSPARARAGGMGDH